MAWTARAAVPALGLAALLLAAGGPWPTRAQSLPLGDGHVSDHPSAGSVYACRSTFRGGGARHSGSWIHGDTWSPAEKPHVSGHVMWPEATFTLRPDGADRLFRGDGLPVGEPTGNFPITPSDSAYRWDTNPNHVGAQNLSFEIPADPRVADGPSCLPMGMIGFTTTGVALFSALDDAGHDAAAHEVQDDCDGHPQANSQYHYHSASPCLPGAGGVGLVGWALDGFPILGMEGPGGRVLTDKDLDACHGQAGKVTIRGKTYGYAYHLTREYPYTLGCFVGTVSADTRADIRRGLEPPRRGRPGRRGPPGGGPRRSGGSTSPS